MSEGINESRFPDLAGGVGIPVNRMLPIFAVVKDTHTMGELVGHRCREVIVSVVLARSSHVEYVRSSRNEYPVDLPRQARATDG